VLRHRKPRLLNIKSYTFQNCEEVTLTKHNRGKRCICKQITTENDLSRQRQNLDIASLATVEGLHDVIYCAELAIASLMLSAKCSVDS